MDNKYNINRQTSGQVIATQSELRKAFKIPDSVAILVGSAISGAIAHKGTNQANTAPQFQMPAASAPDKAIATSALNTPVYSNVEFLAGSYTNEIGNTVNFPFLRYDAVLLTVSQSKKIVKTSIQGQDGDVKEYIGMSDFEIQINGIITAPNGKHPAQEISDLKKMLDAPIAIEISSYYLQNLGIFFVVVDSYELGQDPGGRAYQTFTITCSSDIPRELIITG